MADQPTKGGGTNKGRCRLTLKKTLELGKKEKIPEHSERKKKKAAQKQIPDTDRGNMTGTPEAGTPGISPKGWSPKIVSAKKAPNGA